MSEINILIEIDYYDDDGNSKTYYLANESITGTNVYYPYLYSMPTLGYGGKGFAKVTTGQISILRVENEEAHPFSQNRYYKLMSTPEEIPFRMYYDKEPAPVYVGNISLSEVTEDEIRFMIIEPKFEKELVQPVLQNEDAFEIVRFFLFKPFNSDPIDNEYQLVFGCVEFGIADETEVIIERRYQYEEQKDLQDPFYSLIYNWTEDNRYLIKGGEARIKRFQLTDKDDSSHTLNIHDIFQYSSSNPTIGHLLEDLGFTKSHTFSNGTTGSVLWNIDTPALTSTYQFSITNDDNTTLVWDYDDIMITDETGAPLGDLWEVPTQDEVSTSQVLSELRYFVGSSVSNPFSFGAVTMKSPVVSVGTNQIDVLNFNKFDGPEVGDPKTHPDAVTALIDYGYGSSYNRLVFPQIEGIAPIPGSSESYNEIQHPDHRNESVWTGADGYLVTNGLWVKIQVYDAQRGQWYDFQTAPSFYIGFSKMRILMHRNPSSDRATLVASDNITSAKGKDVTVTVNSSTSDFYRISHSGGGGTIQQYAEWTDATVAPKTSELPHNASTLYNMVKWTRNPVYTELTPKNEWDYTGMDDGAQTVWEFWEESWGPSANMSHVTVYESGTKVVDNEILRTAPNYYADFRSISGTTDANKMYGRPKREVGPQKTLDYEEPDCYKTTSTEETYWIRKFKYYYDSLGTMIGFSWRGWECYIGGVLIDSGSIVHLGSSITPEVCYPNQSIAAFLDNANGTPYCKKAEIDKWIKTEHVSGSPSSGTAEYEMYFSMILTWRDQKEFWETDEAEWTDITPTVGTKLMYLTGPTAGTTIRHYRYDDVEMDYDFTVTEDSGANTYTIGRKYNTTHNYWKINWTRDENVDGYWTASSSTPSNSLAQVINNNSMNSLSYISGNTFYQYYELTLGNTWLLTSTNHGNGTANFRLDKKTVQHIPAVAPVPGRDPVPAYYAEDMREQIYKDEPNKWGSSDSAYGVGWAASINMASSASYGYLLTQLIVENNSVFESDEKTVIQNNSGKPLIPLGISNLPQRVKITNVDQNDNVSSAQTYYRLYRSDNITSSRYLGIIRHKGNLPTAYKVTDYQTTDQVFNDSVAYNLLGYLIGVTQLNISYDTSFPERIDAAYIDLECYAGTQIKEITFYDGTGSSYGGNILGKLSDDYSEPKKNLTKYFLPTGTQCMLIQVESDKDQVDYISRNVQAFEMFIYERFYPEANSSQYSVITNKEYAVIGALESFEDHRNAGANVPFLEMSHYNDVRSVSVATEIGEYTGIQNVYSIRNPNLKIQEGNAYKVQVYDDGVELNKGRPGAAAWAEQIFYDLSDENYIHLGVQPFGQVAVSGVSIFGQTLKEFFELVVQMLNEERADYLNLINTDLAPYSSITNIPIYQTDPITVIEMAERVANATNHQFYFEFVSQGGDDYKWELHLIDVNYAFSENSTKRYLTSEEIQSLQIEFSYPIKALESTFSRNVVYSAFDSQKYGETIMKSIDSKFRVNGTGVGNVQEYQTFAESFDEGKRWLSRLKETEILPKVSITYSGVDREVRIGHRFEFNEKLRKISGFMVVQEILYNFQEDSTTINGISSFGKIVHS